jgi:hypothetical protein
MRRFTTVVLTTLSLGLSLSAAFLFPAQAADDPAYLTIGGGSWEAMRDNLRSWEADLSYRSDYKWWIFKPQGGLLVGGDGDYYGFVGFNAEFHLGKHFVITPSQNFGAWNGHGFNLGSHFEFREGVEVAYQFDNNYRTGIAFYHLSNADISKRNPGSESLLATFSIPLGHPFSKHAADDDADADKDLMPSSPKKAAAGAAPAASQTAALPQGQSPAPVQVQTVNQPLPQARTMQQQPAAPARALTDAQRNGFYYSSFAPMPKVY